MRPINSSKNKLNSKISWLFNLEQNTHSTFFFNEKIWYIDLWLFLHCLFHESYYRFGICLDWAYFCWNWKYCNKIIFKCMNSTMEPIFNEKVVGKRDLWVPWTVHGTHWCALSTAYSLVKCLSLSREQWQWQTTSSHASQL